MEHAQERRYDIDAIRVIAIALLLIYHIAITFQPWAHFYHFIRNETPLQKLWLPMEMLNIWRIPILFLISGMGVYFAMHKRNWKALFLERGRRIGIPLIFGYFVIVPTHIFILQQYSNTPLNYHPTFGHLWFLLNIVGYTILLSPLLFLIRKHNESKPFRFIQNIMNTPFSIYLFLIPFILEVFITILRKKSSCYTSIIL